MINIKWLTLPLLSSLSFFCNATPLPAYYEESGFNAFRSYEDQGAIETIDPLSGGLHR